MIEIRQGEERDIQDLVRVDREAFPLNWPDHLRFLEGHFEAWLEVFPAGLFVAITEGCISGYAMVEIIQHDINDPISTWGKATDNGFIRNTHNPSGNTVYGVSICVAKGTPVPYIGKKLMQSAMMTFMQNKSLEMGVVGSRVPGYHKVISRMTINEYINSRRNSGKLLDPLLAFYESCGFRIVKILPNYIEDPMSHNYGVLMYWPNPNIYPNQGRP